MDLRDLRAHLPRSLLVVAGMLCAQGVSEAATTSVDAAARQSYRLHLRYSAAIGCGQAGSSSTLRGTLVLELAGSHAQLDADLRGSTLSWSSPSPRNGQRRAWRSKERYQGSVQRSGGLLLLRLKLRWPTTAAGMAANLLLPGRTKAFTLRCRAVRLRLTRRRSTNSKKSLRRRAARGLRCAVPSPVILSHRALRAGVISGKLHLGAGRGFAAEIDTTQLWVHKGKLYRR